MNEIHTERLTIRHFKEEDAASCFAGWGKDKNLGKYILGYPMEEQQMRAFVSTLAKSEHAFVLVEKESQSCIGYITMDIPYAQLGIGEIGYALGERYQHKGYAYEAINSVIHKYLVEKGLYMIEAKYNASNTASGALLKKLGFQIDGELRDRRIDPASGRRQNLVVCSITKEDHPEFAGSE